MPIVWTATGQRAWLIRRVEEFKAAQRSKAGMKRFYKRTYRDFFMTWPNQDAEVFEPPGVRLTKKGKVSQRAVQPKPREVKKFATTEEWRKDREVKIWHWFYNYTAGARRGKARLKFNVNVGAASKPKVLSEENLYSKKYYATRVKPKVEAELADTDDAGMRISITKRCLRQAWKGETQETKAEIRDLRKKLVQEKKVSDEQIERLFSREQDPNDIDPEQYLLTQGCLDEIIDEVLHLIATRTGWAMSLNVGGPDMSKPNGEITVKTYHVGNPRGNQTFWSETPNYDEIHAKPFREWCRKFFPEAVRLQRAVDIDMKGVSDPQALVDAGREPGHLMYTEVEDSPEEIKARKRREEAEAEQANTDSPDDEGGRDTEHGDEDEDNNENGGEVVEDAGGDEGEAREGGSDAAEGQTNDIQMEWVVENGIPVPIFVEKGPGSTLAPNASLSLDAPSVQNAGQPLNSTTQDNPVPLPIPATTLHPTTEAASQASMSMMNFNPPSTSLGYGGDYSFNWGPTDANSSWWGPTMGGNHTGDLLPRRDDAWDGGVPYMDGWSFHEGWGTNSPQGPGLPNTHVSCGSIQTAEAQMEAWTGEGQAMEPQGRPTVKAIGALVTDGTGGGLGGDMERGRALVAASGSVANVGPLLQKGKDKGKERRETEPREGAAPGPLLSVQRGAVVSTQKRKNTEQDDDAPPEPAPRPKRVRQARQTQSEDLPDWIEQAKSHLEVGVDHEGWLELVDAWYQFEKMWASTGMSQSGRMQAQKRPAELGPWLQAPRQYNMTPKIDDIHAFANSWLQWWMSVQPGCRKNGEVGLPKPLTKNMDITSLKKGGALGIVVILIGLRWWGTCDELANRWEQAVEDVANVFRRFRTNAA